MDSKDILEIWNEVVAVRQKALFLQRGSATRQMRYLAKVCQQLSSVANMLQQMAIESQQKRGDAK